MTVDKARGARRNFCVGDSKEHGTFSIASAEASPLHKEFYLRRRNANEVCGTIFLPMSKRSFRKQSKRSGKECSTLGR